jgi:hypothetical protein
MRYIPPVSIYCGLIALWVLLLSACTTAKTLTPTTTSVSPTLEELKPTNTSTPDPTGTPAPTNTPAPITAPVQPVYVKAFCTIIGQDKTTRIPIGTPVNIIWGWNAKTEAQINDFLENNITTVTLDGKVIEGIQTGGIVKVEARNDLEVVWVSEVGILEPGQHTITYDQKITKKIEDGYGSYGPGTEHETGHDECLIVVE